MMGRDAPTNLPTESIFNDKFVNIKLWSLISVRYYLWGGEIFNIHLAS